MTWRVPWVTEDDLVRERARQLAVERILDLEEVLAKLVDDVENKWGDPHTLRHAKQCLPQDDKRE